MVPARLDILVHGLLRCAGRGAEQSALDAAFSAATGTACPGKVGQLVELLDACPDARGARALAIRTRPSELVLMVLAAPDGRASSTDTAASWIAAFAAAAAQDPLLALLDTSHGVAAFGLRGPRTAPLLARLADPSSLPATDAAASRLRLADCAVMLVRDAVDDYVLVADADSADFLLDRIAFAESGFE